MIRISISFFGMLIWLGVSAQKHNWQNMDLRTDTVFGISTEKAYRELLINKKATPVIVAVIDEGIDTSHKDLRFILWTNPREVAGNGLDDDHNGYIDDLHGWNFIGNEIGQDDITRMAGLNKSLYDSLAYGPVPIAYQKGYQLNRVWIKEYKGHVNSAQGISETAKKSAVVVNDIVESIGKPAPKIEDFQRYVPRNEDEQFILNRILMSYSLYPDFLVWREKEVNGIIREIQYHLDHGLNLIDTLYNDRMAVELPEDQTVMKLSEDRNGNNDVNGPYTLVRNPGAYHGTHVAGIIAATRKNDTNMRSVADDASMHGVADHVQIMTLKVLSYLRELREHNLARAIRYAADNGAKVINLSFLKPYTFDKKGVDDAVKYAMAKDVLIVHAAGNSGQNIDGLPHFPNPVYGDSSGRAAAWIEVGASRPYDDTVLVAAFSNYGKATVDVFAPGTGIYSTIPGGGYEKQNGTSMAAPVVSGLAALIREYYPRLTAVQVKDIILRSVTRVEHDVYVYSNDQELLKIPFSEVCISGGVVNAYNALRLAASYK